METPLQVRPLEEEAGPAWLSLMNDSLQGCPGFEPLIELDYQRLWSGDQAKTGLTLAAERSGKLVGAVSLLVGSRRGRLRDLATLFLELRTCMVASTYANSWIFTALDPDDPIRSMARAYTELFIVRADAVKEDYISDMVEFFKADGILFHDAKTCPNNSNNRYGMPERLRGRLEIPFGQANQRQLIKEIREELEALHKDLGGK